MVYNVYVDQNEEMIACFELNIDGKEQKCLWTDKKASVLWGVGESYEMPKLNDTSRLYKSFDGIMTIKLRPATPEEIVIVKLSAKENKNES